MFITFEGIEGSGKSSQSQLTMKWLQSLNIDVLISREPGGSAMGSVLRQILLDQGSDDISAETELFLYLADRAQHVSQVIKPALQMNKVVILDRFTDSTVAYQGYGRGMDIQLLHRLNDLATSGLRPDITFLLDLPVQSGLFRARARNRAEDKTKDEGRFEAEETEFHQRVRKGYLQLAAENKCRIIVLDGEKAKEEIIKDIKHALGNYFPQIQKAENLP